MESATELVTRADRALYLAKQRGKSRVAHYDRRLDDDAARQAAAVEVLADALKGDLLEPTMRPLVDVSGRRIVAQYHRPEWGDASKALACAAPGCTPPVAAAIGCSSPALFDWMLTKVAGNGAMSLGGVPVKHWVDMPCSVLMGSPAHALDAAAEHGVRLDRFVVVIDEDVLAGCSTVDSTLGDIASRGTGVAIGHFGARTGSLAIMDSHPLEAVWLDRRLVDGVATSRVNQAKISALAMVAESLGQNLVADRPLREDDGRTLRELAALWVVDGHLELDQLARGRGRRWREPHP